MKEEDARTMALNLMKKHHIFPMFNFKFCNAKTTLGWCNYDYGNFCISVSLSYAKESSRSKVKEVILHEIAHALDYLIRGESFHDEFWRQIFIKIGGSGKTVIED